MDPNAPPFIRSERPVKIVDFTEEPSNVIRMRGLPFTATEADVRNFLDGFAIVDPDGVLVPTHGEHRGEAFIRLISPEEADRAIRQKNRQNIGERYVEIYFTPQDEMDRVMSEELQYGSLTTNPIVRLRGLPFQASEDDIRTFFCVIADKIVNLRFAEDGEGRRTGEAFLEVLDDDAVAKALTKHRLLMGTRYIEVLTTTAVERETLLHVASRRNKKNGSGTRNTTMPGGGALDGSGLFPAGLSPNAMPPLMPPMPFPLLPKLPPLTGLGIPPSSGPVKVQIGKDAAQAAAANQVAHAATSFMLRTMMMSAMMPPMMVPPMMPPMVPPPLPLGPTPPTPQRPQSRYIVRIRGLPFTASEGTVAEFFHDVSIPPQGVHMVYNSQERPTGEAFVEVETEEDINTALKHNGGALGHRYIEVFRSSASDMLRLSGGPPEGVPPLPMPPGPFPPAPMMNPMFGAYYPYGVMPFY